MADFEITKNVSHAYAKFNQYYVDFVACIAGLLPVNFSQVERVSIQFDVGQQELDKEHQARLSLIATYVLADPLVTTVYIDAHTDNQGTRYLNRRVAEKRMLKTLDWLVSLGVDPNMVIARYHGDRYPVESNETIAGRAANRRVTLRLERLINQPDDPLNRHPQFARNYR